ncbi:MAG: toxin-antitoxin system YwqK family antitoxin [Planctomycetota bacterium]|nr:toxin-antitoxin system YwqK family antitoxin [Planctomycetota bacterium]
MQILKLTVLIGALLAGPLSAQGEEAGADADDLKLLPAQAQKTLAQFKAALPAGFDVRAEVRKAYSDDEAKIVGHLLSLCPVDGAGLAEGEARYYGEHLQVLRTVPYKQGKKEGLEKKFALGPNEKKPELVLESETPWNADRVHGVKKLYHSNGKLRSETTYVNGAREGESKSYDLPGRLERVTAYKNDKREGEMLDYWTATGKPKRIVPYKADKVDGTVKEFYESGQVRREVPLKDDRFDGIEVQYDESGAIARKRYWIQDKEVDKDAFDKRP